MDKTDSQPARLSLTSSEPARQKEAPSAVIEIEMKSCPESALKNSSDFPNRRDVEHFEEFTELSTVCWVCKTPSRLIVPCECPPEVGSVHKACLINWMNSLLKGRCPKCLLKYKTATKYMPLSEWRVDPVMLRNKHRYISMVAINFIIALFSLGSVWRLLSNEGETTKSRIGFSIAIATGFLLYILYQVRLYMRLLERLSIFNKPVIDVFEHESDGWGHSRIVQRGNFFSLVNPSEME